MSSKPYQVSTIPIPSTHISNSSDDSSVISPVNSPKAENPEKFSIITGAEKNKWDNECFRNVLEKDMRFYRGAVETL
ncbi:hypothetical protein GLOIN_2v921480 [Rhizophagus irregularis DAOM 181602=DAOM 197198]|uniref:Uncharacterized protein n=1 Tax=Rhizophagus irregularis (strain DAOM 181602 / DAOM 197198 / MUCL 43194) TaxID=747089 RepID=U9U892_RHIID|nr:hypothetical protein GLOIN_2v921480 [Rhizophagus irregularis DAOM 181602=DAOM 197198]CAB4487168.1 unnamed protein product [Rhizophagus irregularis]